MIQIPKGCKDVLPSQVYAWHKVEDTARAVAEAYAFREIRTPVFEHTELFSRGVGDTTDIVNKEMYTFLDKGGRSVTLRPEGTAGVARAFLEHGLAGGVLPFKAYYLISAFRYERPPDASSTARRARRRMRKSSRLPMRSCAGSGSERSRSASIPSAVKRAARAITRR